MIYLADCIKYRYPLFYESIKVIAGRGVLDLCFIKSKNPWSRDFYPVKIGSHLVQFNYAPFYHRQKQYKEPEPPVNLRLNKNKSLINAPFDIDGGAVIYESSKSKLFISEKYYAKEVSEFFAQMDIKCEMIFSDPDDFTGHLDGLYRILDQFVVYSEYLDELAPAWHEKNKQIFQNLGYALMKIPDVGIYQGADYFKGTYLNFLIHETTILLPKSTPPGLQLDKITAIEKIVERFFSSEFGLKAIWVNCDEPMNDGGAIHCLTWDD